MRTSIAMKSIGIIILQLFSMPFLTPSRTSAAVMTMKSAWLNTTSPLFETNTLKTSALLPCAASSMSPVKEWIM